MLASNPTFGSSGSSQPERRDMLTNLDDPTSRLRVFHAKGAFYSFGVKPSKWITSVAGD